MNLVNQVKEAVIEASTTIRDDQFQAYQQALENEKNSQASWILKILMENARIAKDNKVPLCDDTGIPHILVEIGKNANIPGNFFEELKYGVAQGLRELPGRPMAVKGNAIDRIEQKKGLYTDPGELIPPSFIVDEMEPKIGMEPEKDQNKVRVNVLMLGGGPEIRAHTYRVFHKRDYKKLFEEVTKWTALDLPKLGCTPCIPTIGIGRTHFEASTLMLKAMIYGNLKEQSEIEKELTQSINRSGTGPLGLGGSVTALGSLIKIGPQRASGVRIVSMRPCCCVEPRVASFDVSL